MRLVCQERTVACLLSPGGGVWSLVFIHLDSPETTIEAVFPESPHARPFIHSGRSCSI